MKTAILYFLEICVVITLNKLLGGNMDNQKIAKTIMEYAVAYGKLQTLQETIASIPEGDQKTGCIGEYYSYRYLQHSYPNSKLKYGSHSEKGWDIEIIELGLRVQVKTVSAFSKTRTISPIHKGWDILHILYLSKELQPEGFWIIEDTSIFGESETLTSKKCRLPGKNNTGSFGIPFGQNHINTLRKALEIQDA